VWSEGGLGAQGIALAISAMCVTDSVDSAQRVDNAQSGQRAECTGRRELVSVGSVQRACVEGLPSRWLSGGVSVWASSAVVGSAGLATSFPKHQVCWCAVGTGAFSVGSVICARIEPKTLRWGVLGQQQCGLRSEQQCGLRCKR